MACFTTNISSAEQKALLREMGDDAKIQAWLDNAVKNKARRCMDDVITKETSQRPDLLSVVEKEAAINDLP